MAQPPSKRSSPRDIEQFIERSKAITAVTDKQPRLLFAVDATASRQPTWDTACQLQSEMFLATRSIATLSVQLCYYRGFHEFHASRWLTDSTALAGLMGRVRCEGGHTQIKRLLKYAMAEHGKTPIRALVFIGDAVEESPDTLCDLAGQSGLRGLPLFVFQEGRDPRVARTFKSMARVSGGVYARFDRSSAAYLASLLGAVARYAAGGHKALRDSGDEGARLLLSQLK